MTIAEALRIAGVDFADARVLLREILRADEAHLLAHPGQHLTEAQRAGYLAWVERRRSGEPVAYLTGSREFYGLALRVTPAVLIPRPETELLVEAALERIPADQVCRVLDLATGSGCVAVAIAKHRPRAQITATDVSSAALAIARENAARHGVSIEFFESDWFAALAGRKFDLIVSNPPYVAEGDPHLDSGDLRFEPRSALAAGLAGLDSIEVIVEQAVRHLASGGQLLFEHGYDQGPCSRTRLAAAGFLDIATRRDLAGIERVSGGGFDGAPGQKLK
ncbi:MAG TPA: peptide chain release factor N(5)-glutamine methyltransferase [Burkholderiales bacterium]|nr:peptide chain release factor N(5)-glutamine methyltransferase [Burkholderiales bacterium]